MRLEDWVWGWTPIWRIGLRPQLEAGSRWVSCAVWGLQSFAATDCEDTPLSWWWFWWRDVIILCNVFLNLWHLARWDWQMPVCGDFSLSDETFCWHFTFLHLLLTSLICLASMSFPAAADRTKVSFLPARGWWVGCWHPPQCLTPVSNRCDPATGKELCEINPKPGSCLAKVSTSGMGL